jgi:molecular chaperone GrpE (heat shock protein)
MYNSLCRFLIRSWQWVESRGILGRRRRVTGNEWGPKTPLNPLTAVNCGLRDVADGLDQQLATTHRLMDQVASLETEAADAWRERESLSQQYHDLIRSLLEVLDDCSESLDGEVLETVRTKLERVLNDHDILPIVVAENSPFQAELHCCEETVELPGQPGGTVIRVLRCGYIQRRKDGTMVVIRPARVIASKTNQIEEIHSHGIGP